MDIDSVIKEKKYLEKALWLYHKFCKKQEEIRDTLIHTGNPITQILHEVLMDVHDNTNEKHQKRLFTEPLELGLFVATKDTAYEQQMYYALYKILTEHRDKLLKHLEAEKKIVDFTDPSKWGVNEWHNSKEKTKKLRDKGILTKNMVSGEEVLFINEYHSEKLKKMEVENDS